MFASLQIYSVFFKISRYVPTRYIHSYWYLYNEELLYKTSSCTSCMVVCHSCNNMVLYLTFAAIASFLLFVSNPGVLWMKVIIHKVPLIHATIYRIIKCTNYRNINNPDFKSWNRSIMASTPGRRLAKTHDRNTSSFQFVFFLT